MSRQSHRPTSTLTGLEKTVLVHTGLLLLAASWIYGGNLDWVRTVLGVWGSLGAVLTGLAFVQRGSRGREARRKAWWLLPLGMFSVLVLASLFNPSFRIVYMDGAIAYVKTPVPHPGWPSTISLDLSLRSWWFGAGVYLSAFNLACVIQSRSVLQGCLVFMAANTFVLSVFGTLQKLGGSGFYFGAHESPNPRFFATFIYYNHWGAFVMLGLSTAVGLLFYQARRVRGRNLWHSPFSAALLGVLVIATSAPVSASRASTIIVALVAAIALVHALVRVTASHRAQGRSLWAPLTLILLLAVGASSAIGWLSYRSLSERFTETRAAIDHDQSLFGGRAELYRDTWRLALQQPVFGWGLDTYEVGFQQIRPYAVTRPSSQEQFYATAHNDWLQALAETGFVGGTLLLFMGLVPLMAVPRRQWLHPLTAYPLLGCLLVALYAFVEFPFANGAVLISFCLLLFITVRHAQLTDLASRSRPS